MATPDGIGLSRVSQLSFGHKTRSSSEAILTFCILFDSITMHCSNDSLAEYIDDLPMKLSRRFEPLRLDVLTQPLPSVPPLRLDEEDHYAFHEERTAIRAAENRNEEICQEAQKVRIRLGQQQMQEPIQPNHHPAPAAQPPPPPPPPPPLTGTTLGANTITELPLPLTQVPIQSQLPPPVPPVQLPPVSNALTSASMNSVLPPVELQGAFSHTPSESNAKTDTSQFKINPREFEIFDSSPFDDALLRSIDERQELNLVFGGGNSASSVHR